MTNRKQFVVTFLTSLVLLFAGAVQSAPIQLMTPDLKELGHGIKSYDRGRKEYAMQKFLSAATWGNKDAQYTIAVMYVEGDGVAVDYPRAHAWMSLAATQDNENRRDTRNRLWEFMDDDAKATARAIYKELNPTYGDLAALSKRDEWARKEKRSLTGSRTGSGSSQVRVDVPTVGGATRRMTGTEYYGFLNDFVAEVESFEYDIEYGDLNVVENRN